LVPVFVQLNVLNVYPQSSTHPKEGTTFSLPPGSSSSGKAVALVLQQFSGNAVIKIHRPAEILTSFGDRDLTQEFNRELRKLTAYWCCR
jgi:hypothetical protein